MAGVEVRYTGFVDGVELRDADGTIKGVARGGTVRVHRDVANSLIKQDGWARVKPDRADDPDGDDPEGPDEEDGE
jgi:hypothetical protein